MPGGDRTGPIGMGPRTGRGAGYCAGYAAPGYANPAFGRGLGRGRGVGIGFGRGRFGAWGGGYGGGGRGWRNMFHATGQPGWMRFGGYAAPYDYPEPDPEAEAQALKARAQALQSELDAIKKRMEEVKSGTENPGA